MRILYHHRTLGDGAEGIHVREMVRAFRSLGHEVKVVGPVGEATPELSSRQRILERVKRALPVAFYELMEMVYTVYAFLLISREIRAFRPDFIYDRYIIFNAGGVLASRFGSVPILLEVNAPLALERIQQLDERLVFRRIARAMEAWTCTRATQTVVVSSPLKSYLESIGVPKDKCIVMPNGVDPVRFAPRARSTALREQLGIPADAIVVGFTGVLRPWHGLDLLLEAIADVVRAGHRVFLLIVGDGPYRPIIDGIVTAQKLESRVRVTGRLPHDQVPDYVALFDLAVSPRATFYASPMKVIEYMALGKAVVVPGTPNFLDMIDDGVNGVTFPEGDRAGLAAVLGSLCETPARCAQLGSAARQKVENRLNWRWNALEVCRLIAT
jgi:glycosyltransferase involved in cell wall biosynthesis